MALYPAFIKSHSRLLILHRFQQRQRLAFAHLAFFFRLGLRHLRLFVRRFLLILVAGAFYFAGKFFRGRFFRRGGRSRVFVLAWCGGSLSAGILSGVSRGRCRGLSRAGRRFAASARLALALCLFSWRRSRRGLRTRLL